MHVRLLNDEGYPQCLCGYFDATARDGFERLRAVDVHVHEKLATASPEEVFTQYPKNPEIALTRSGLIMNLRIQKPMLTWENEEDNGRLWTNYLIRESGQVTRVEIAVWKLIKETFGEDYAS